jgi:hypothetical protein
MLVLLLMLMAFAAPASAQSLGDVGAKLRTDPVYVDPSAELAGAVDADALREKIRTSGAAPMYIAVLPGSGSPDQTLRALHSAVGARGTYALIDGRTFRAGSDLFPAAADATAARQESSTPEETLEAFIERVADRQAGRRPSSSSGGGGGGGGGIGIFGIFLLLLLAGGLGLWFVGRRRKRRAEQEELAEVKENVRDDLVALGDDIRALDLDVQMPDADPAAKEDYARAVEAYDRANRVFETARRVDDLAPAAEALEEGRFAMTSAKARLAGRRPPERRPPCFFDPRHGPSTRDVLWAPPGGTPRPVPACEADAQRVERGEDPHAREILMGGRRVPYWEAGPAYAPFYGGFFGGFGGFLPGLLLGSMVGGMWDPTPGWGGEPGWGDGGFDGGDPGGGDFGGGDFGGGDFGGGDFGGGDFGGGDFGGGGDF